LGSAVALGLALALAFGAGFGLALRRLALATLGGLVATSLGLARRAIGALAVLLRAGLLGPFVPLGLARLAWAGGLLLASHGVVLGAPLGRAGLVVAAVLRLALGRLGSVIAVVLGLG